LQKTNTQVGYSYKVAKKKSSSSDVRYGLLIALVGFIFGIIFNGGFIGNFAFCISGLAL
jgi:hypothetical protein